MPLKPSTFSSRSWRAFETFKTAVGVDGYVDDNTTRQTHFCTASGEIRLPGACRYDHVYNMYFRAASPPRTSKEAQLTKFLTQVRTTFNAVTDLEGLEITMESITLETDGSMRINAVVKFYAHVYISAK